VENPKTGEINTSELPPNLAEIAAVWPECLLLYQKKIVKIFADESNQSVQDVA